MVSLNCSTIADTSGICSTLESVGVGLGVFLQALVLVLPYFLIAIGVIGGVIAIFMAIAGVIKGSIKVR